MPGPRPHEAPEKAREGERIAKLLARAGVASRRDVERMIAEGRVKLDAVVVTTPATILPNLKGVSVDDVPVAAAPPARLFLFHKPAGLITAERDPAGRPTIYTALRNALPRGAGRVMPVGRLDLSTEGLLLLTNDGELKRALELPATGIPRTYRARTFGDISQGRLEALMDGIEIEGVRYGPIDANMERRTGRNQWVELTLTEGKNREVRRVLEHLGLQVSRLLRVRYGPFLLGELPRGGAEEVPQVVVERFRKALKLGSVAQQPTHAGKAPPPRVTAAAIAAWGADRTATPRTQARRPVPPKTAQGRGDPGKGEFGKDEFGKAEAGSAAPARNTAARPARGRAGDARASAGARVSAGTRASAATPAPGDLVDAPRPPRRRPPARPAGGGPRNPRGGRG